MLTENWAGFSETGVKRVARGEEGEGEGKSSRKTGQIFIEYRFYISDLGEIN